MKECPYCHESVEENAVFCPECRKNLQADNREHAARWRREMERFRKKESRPGARILATAGIITGLLGFAFAAIPLGIVAILCGLAALAMGSSEGIFSLILGVLDILLSLVMMYF